MENIIKKEICPNVNFTCIPDKKFKTTIISFSMFTPLNEQNISQNAIIPGLLAHSCKKYPSLLNLSLKLEELYGASIVPGIGKLGDKHILTVSAQCTNNEFIAEFSNNISETATLLNEVIFNPDISEKSFEEKNIEQEKRQLIEDIEAELSDKKSYARRKCTEQMCKNEKFGISPIGTIENAKKLDGKTVFKAWKNLLQSSHIEIMMIGSGEYESTLKKFKDNFDQIERKSQDLPKDEIIKKADTIKEVSEIMDVIQCKLVMGFRTETAKPGPNVEATKVMSALLGGTPQSKLFVNVREKLSLCYYCSSRYISQKGILFIESGVEKSNVEKAKKEILNQIQEIKAGNFSDKDFEETKMYISQSIEKTKDNLEALEAWYNSQAFDKIKYSPDEMIEKINKVTREQVTDAAQRLTLDTVYLLSGKEN